MRLWGGPRPDLPAAYFTTEQAVRFARWAVERFTRFPVIWSVSGDAPYDEESAKWDAVEVPGDEIWPAPARLSAEDWVLILDATS